MLNFYQIISSYYDEMNTGRQCNTFQFEEDPLNKDVRGISKIYHEVLLLQKFLQTEPQVKNMNSNSHDFY